MEDDKSLDLSLGLQLRGGGDKGKRIAASDDVSRDTKLINDFKNFLEGGTVKHDPELGGSQRTVPIKTEENFFNNLSETPADEGSSKGPNGSESRSTEVEGEKGAYVGDKRKSLFGEVSQPKRLESESHLSDLRDKTRVSHVSITTDEGSTADNEDVADSGAVGSKKHPGNAGPSEVHKEVHRISDSSTSNYKSPDMMHMMVASNNERGGSQPVGPANMPLMFGYSTVQLPTLNKDNSPVVASFQQQFHPSFGGRGQIGLDKHNDIINVAPASTPVISHKSSESPQFDARGTDNIRGNGKRTIPVEGSISRMEDDGRVNNMIFRPTPSDQPRSESIPSEYPDIRPGIAADIKFGGSGSSPNLPWVSTTGPGQNGKTISGVTYRFSPTQIKIVCACHGSHMSPEEFVRHASEGQAKPDAGTSASTFPSNNSAASAQS